LWHQHYLKKETCPDVGGDEWEAWTESLEIKGLSVWQGEGGTATNLKACRCLETVWRLRKCL